MYKYNTIAIAELKNRSKNNDYIQSTKNVLCVCVSSSDGCGCSTYWMRR